MRFHVLETPTSGLYGTDFDMEDLKTGEVTSTCPACGRRMGSREWLPPHRVNVIRYGKHFGDISIGIGNSVFVSEKFRQAWLLERLNGITSFDPIEVVKIRPAKVAPQAPRYWHIIPLISSTAADYGRSHFLWDRAPTCNYCGGGAGMDAAAGFVIDQSTWTGEDMFKARNVPGTVIVTERFAEMIRQHHLTNATLIPVEQYLWDPLHKIVPYSKDKN